MLFYFSHDLNQVILKIYSYMYMSNVFPFFAEVLFIPERTAALDTQTRQLQDMFDTRQQKYLCEACTKKFKTIGGLQRHLRKEHDWFFMEEVTNSSSKKDHIALYRASFMKCSLLCGTLKTHTRCVTEREF